MGNLDYAEKESSQIERKVKSKEQISQEQNSWLKNNAQNISSQDLYSLINNYSLSNPQIQTETQNFKSRNSKALNVVLTKEATPNEIKENPEITKKLNLYQNLTNNLKTSLKDIQKNLNDSTSLSLRAMDAVVGVFSDNNVFNTYASSFEITKGQARQILTKLLEIDQKILTPKQKEIFASLQKELNQILSLKLEKTGIVQMLENEFEQIPQNLNYAAHGLKGEAIGLYEGTKAIITGSVDLLTFMIKYPFNSKYRQEINKQAEIIYDFVKKEGLSGVEEKVYEAIGKEMDRISKLPPEKQAQAIGEIAGNVISMLAVVKAGTTIASKLGKVGQAEKLIVQAEATGNIARAEKVREIASTLLASKRGLQSFEIILTGVAESVLLKGLSVSYKATLGFLENIHLSTISKVEFLEQRIQEARQMKGESPEENLILQRYIEELEINKKEFYNKFIVEDIAKLGDKERLEAGSFYLKGKKFTPEQEKAILEAHNVGKDRKGAGIYNYTNEEIKQKAEILKQTGFSLDERRILLQNGVCAKVSDEKLFQLNILGDTLDKQVDYLFKLAQETRKDYDSLLTEIGAGSNSSKILNSETVPLKGKENVVSKINAEYGGRHPEMVRDILRGSIVYNDLSDLRRGLQMFKDSEKVSVIHINNRLKNPNTNDILMNIRFPNGFVAEVQLHIKETLHAKEIGFKLDKSIIDLDSRFTDAERKLIQDIKEGKRGTRILNENVNLPSNGETVSGHHIYEITRSLGETMEETILKKKLNKVQEVLNNYARDLYTQRTGKDFI